MTPFALSGILATISAFTFGIVVLTKSSDRKLARVWFAFSLSAVGWGLGATFIGLAKNSESALLAWKLAYMFGVVWIPSLFYHFICVFCGTTKIKSIWINYLVSLIFFILVPSQYFFSRIEFAFSSLYYARSGPMFPLFFAWWISFVIYSHLELVRYFRAAPGYKKTQIKYFFLATAIGYCGGSMSYLPIFGLRLYPWGNFTVTLYPLIMSYAMLKYHLMDIRLFFRRAGILLLVYATLILIAIPIMILVHQRLSVPMLVSPAFLITEVLVLAAILSLGPFIYAYIVRQSTSFNEDTIASLAHELKGPLASVEGALNFIFEADADPSQRNTYRAIIERNITRLSNSVADLIQVMQFQQLRGLVRRDINVDLKALVLNLLQKYQSLADSKKLSLVLAADPAKVSCDSEKIEQVLSNLISNSIKFSERGTIRIQVTNNMHEILIQVIDQGKGIAKVDLEKIFERFYQGSKDKTSKGTGIGLTIAKTWVEAHGGKIWAESEGEGKGTTVVFTLPLV